MKNLLGLIVLLTILTGCKNDKVHENDTEHNHTSTKEVEVSKKKVLSPHTSAMAMIGDAHIHIDYSSPGVRNRIIFGGLLSFDAIWQAGAHKATWLETNKDLIFQNQKLPAGKYGVFVIPSVEEWTIIFNSNWDQHGKDDYDEKDDVIRFKVKPIVSETVTEHLEYKVNKTDETSGIISLAWDKVTVQFPFSVTK